ncbi:hypothetical protein GC194_12030 [bacterium]|nr:hypothetical protein [bacterium]
MKYYLPLKEEIDKFIDRQYEFKLDQKERSKAIPNFNYRRKGNEQWNDGEMFGKLERDYIATQPKFNKYETTIKLYFPYRLFYKIVADKVMQHA